jgi:hypothetical protein
MIAAALYLVRRSLVNATRHRVARLRQPKYLIGFVVGCLYVYWLVFRPQSGTALGSAFTPAGDVWAVGVLAALVVFNWIFGSAETPFTFTLAETQYLFTAPLTRRQVIDFKLIRSQLALLISAAISGVFLSRGLLGGLRLFHVVGLWLVYATLQLHYGGMALLRATLTQHGASGLRRRLVTVVLLGTVVALGWWSLRPQLPGLVAAFARDPAQGYAAVAGAMHSGLLGVLLWPLEALLGPLRAPDAAAFAARLPAALLVGVANYVWVVRSALAFEEAAVEHAVKVARRIEALRQGRALGRPLRAPKAHGIRLPLAATGAPSAAILWKNVVAAMRDASPRTLILFTALIIGGPLVAGGGPAGGREVLATILLALGVIALLLGPLAARFDLRQDLEMLEVLKSYPVRGRDIVRGEVAAPVVLLGGIVWICLAGGLLALAGRREADVLTTGDRLAILLALLSTTGAILAVLVLVQNGAVLLFPAWVTIGRNRVVGLEAAGQRILMTAGSLVVLSVALLPAVILGGLVGAAVQAAGVDAAGTASAGAVAGSGVVVFEVALAVHLLGDVFDRLEPGALGGG